VALDPQRSRAVIAELVRETGGGYWKSRIYVTGAAGDNPQLMQEVDGAVQSASVSGDGRWLLFQTQRNTANVERSIWALRLDTPWATRNANKLKVPDATLLDTVIWNGRVANPRLSGSFLPSSDGRAQVVVSRSESGAESLTIYELDSDVHVHIWEEDVRTGPDRRADISALSRDGKYLAARHMQGDGSTIGLSGVQPGYRTWSSVPLPATATESVRVQFAPGNEEGEYAYVVAGVYNAERISSGSTQALYSAPVLRNGTISSIKKVGTARLPLYEEMPTLALPGKSAILAYISEQDELHTVFLDGTQDTIVESNVRAVWSLTMPKDVSWRR
jgi:hypothetical protein